MCSDLPSTTRLVLHTLAAHMDSSGGSCFPSTATVAEESGLSKRVVIHHINLAVEKCWITKGVKGVNGQGWKRHKYQAAIPGEDNAKRNKKRPGSRKATRRKRQTVEAEIDMTAWGKLSEPMQEIMLKNFKGETNKCLRRFIDNEDAHPNHKTACYIILKERIEGGDAG